MAISTGQVAVTSSATHLFLSGPAALVLNSPNGLGFNLESPDRTVQAIVNRNSAEEIDTCLHDRKVETLPEMITWIA